MVITGDWFYGVTTALAVVLTFFAGARKNILLTFSASLTWLGLSLVLFFSPVPVWNLGDIGFSVLIWVFFMLVFVPLLLHMDVLGTHKGSDGTTWQEWGSRPQVKQNSKYWTYRDSLRRRIMRVRRIR